MFKSNRIPAVALAAVLAPALAFANPVTGRVELTGTPPAMGKLHREADAFCAKKPMNDEAVQVGKDKGLANVWVHVISGAPDDPAPATAVTVEQTDCMYRPRIQMAVKGQKIEAKNNDPTLHNVHTYFGPATVFNKGMPNEHAKPIEYTTDKDGVMKWKCDVHPWMRGYVGVNKNHYQAITDKDGNFTIDLPAGKTYKLEAWHEKFGPKQLELAVPATKGPLFQYAGTETAN